MPGSVGLAAVAALAVLVPASDAAAVGSSLPETLAGVYKSQFKNALVDGETYRSEDILEIAPTAPDAAYVRAHLEFYNGHLCAIFGIAHVERNELVFRDSALANRATDGRCVLHVTRRADKITLSDEGGSCQDYCGAGGSLSDDSFPAASRRPIRYLARLKSSWQFKQALAQDAARKGVR